MRVPLATLLSPRARPRRCATRISAATTFSPQYYGDGSARRATHGTSHLSVVDGAGNAVACTTSINTAFGSMVVAGDTGIILNNTMDDFSAQPGVPNVYGLIGSEANAIAPGKRPLSSMTPTIVTRGGQVAAVAGGSGGPLIITGTLQVLLNALVFGQDADAAVGAARLHHQWMPPVLMVEPGIDGGTRQALRRSRAQSDRCAGGGLRAARAARAGRHARRRLRSAQGRQGRRVVTRWPRLRAALRSRAFKLALSAALLALLLLATDVREMRAAVAAAKPGWLLLALLLYLGSQVVSAARWWLLTRAVGFEAPFGRVIAYYFSGMYMNLFAPGTVSGDVGRTLLLAEGRRRALALTTVVAHRATGFVALVWVAAIGIVGVQSLPIPVALRALAALAVPLTLAGWLAGPRLAARLLPANNRWRRMIERELAPFWNDWRLLAASLTGGAMTHVLQISGQLAVSRALGLALPWTFFWVVAPLLNFGSTLPFTFNGIGLREAGYWYALSGSSVGDASAIGIGLLTSAVVLATGLCGLPFFLLWRPRKRGSA